jgi:GrpB-like predicted nucleotidyltransferase (UPF0157 family)
LARRVNRKVSPLRDVENVEVLMRVLVGEYKRVAPAYHQYDPRAAVVAQVLADAICSKDERLDVEHVGSSSVLGCGGKGYIDLLVTYPVGALEVAKQALSELGFQRQQSRNPFPEERTMRVGSIEHAGRVYLIHAHVVAATSSEVEQILLFRDRLRSDGALARAYEHEKQRILAEGVLDSKDYAKKKGVFIEQVLDVRTNPAPHDAG